MLRHQRTLKSVVRFEGVGLHTGAKTVVEFHPAEGNNGIRFHTNHDGKTVEIPATVEYVPQDEPFLRNTTLAHDGVRIHTVEHVLATLYGLSIDNCNVVLEGPEPPEPEDGSCKAYVDALLGSGIIEQGVPAPYYEVNKPVQWHREKEGIGVSAIPYEGFRISFTIKYDNEVIGTQYASFDVTPEIFAEEIAPARTFALKEEVDFLRGQGLIKGGTLRNALVVDEEKILNEEPLRFPDEFVRHKILDLIGDLSLFGLPIRGHVISLKSGHEMNVQFVRKMASYERGTNRVYGDKKPTHWDIAAIMDILPHRYPFLLVDRIVDLVPGEHVVGLKNVTINEPFFEGHFPGHPIMPGVLVVEAMAQAGGVLLLSMIEQPETKLVYFTAINNTKFRRPILPGDQLTLDVKMVKFKRNICRMNGLAKVDGEVVAEAELVAAVVDR